MMLGEMEFTGIFFSGGNEEVPYSGMTYVIFIVFMVVLAIVVTNLLVGLAVDDVNQLQAHAKLRKVAMQASSQHSDMGYHLTITTFQIRLNPIDRHQGFTCIYF